MSDHPTEPTSFKSLLAKAAITQAPNEQEAAITAAQERSIKTFEASWRSALNNSEEKKTGFCCIS